MSTRLIAAALGLIMAAAPAFQVAMAQLAPARQAGAGFDAYIASLWPLAQQKGISRAVFDLAFRGVTSPDPAIIRLTKAQSEFVKPIWGYLDSAVTGGRINEGRGAAQQWAAALSRAESSTGVPKEIILGIWGMETNYGSFKGSMDVIRSLTTLASLNYRGTFFRDELMDALLILQKGLADRGDLVGSWAGAMGHTQFMPSSFLKYATDGSGDGVIDIWDNPADAIASTGNYLRQFGWKPGLPWGFEVMVPAGYDHRLHRGSFSAFAAAGIRRADGAAMPAGEARLFLPAGAGGPAFLLTANFDVIKSYNSSDAYALAVAHLGDRIMGRGAIQQGWPRNAPRLSKKENEEVQRRLTALGLYKDKIDGRMGTGSREAVRAFQLRNNMLADAYASPAVLARLRQAAR
jgi:membrane-bound lytic murein transglycosylase B